MTTTNMNMIQIEVDMDYVRIEGQLVNRPVLHSRGAWLKYWKAIQDLEKIEADEDDAFERGREAGQEEVKVDIEEQLDKACAKERKKCRDEFIKLLKDLSEDLDL